VVYGLNQAVSVPIQELSEAYQGFGAGDVSVMARNSSRDEIGDLSRSVNQMAVNSITPQARGPGREGRCGE